MKRKKNEHGHGTITPMRSGRFWARAPLQPDGKRPGLGTYATREEAERVLASAVYQIDQGAARDGSPTFAQYGRHVLNVREGEGTIRSIGSERLRFARHLETSPLANLRLREIRPVDVSEFVRALAKKEAADKRGKRLLSRETLKRCLTLVSVIMSEALAAGHVDANPCTGIRVRTRGHEEGTRDPWTYLTPEEQATIRRSAAIPLPERLMIRFAMGTGLRQGEQWNLELRDLHTTGPKPHVRVRFGSKGRPPKSGKQRIVPLFGDGLAAAREWLELLPTYARSNPDRLVFPGPEGARRRPGKLGTSARFGDLLRAAGIKRRVRWHDLRHTCASSLVAGWWGRTWSFAEVRDLLGHGSIAMTERYGHLAHSALEDAARKTPDVGYGMVAEPKAVVTIEGETGSRLRDLNSRPTVYEGQDKSSSYADLGALGNQMATNARKVLEFAAAGEAEKALAVAVTLAESVLQNVGRSGQVPTEGTGS